MATTSVCGTTGSVSICGEVTNIKIDITLDTPEATSMSSSGNKEFLPCLKGWSGSFDSFLLGTTIGAHASATFTLATGKTVSGNIIITDIKINDEVAGVVTFNYTFNGTGAATGIGV